MPAAGMQHLQSAYSHRVLGAAPSLSKLQVLDTFVYADKQLLQAYPELLRAKVYVHFQSDVQVRGGGAGMAAVFVAWPSASHVVWARSSCLRWLCCSFAS